MGAGIIPILAGVVKLLETGCGIVTRLYPGRDDEPDSDSTNFEYDLFDDRGVRVGTTEEDGSTVIYQR